MSKVLFLVMLDIICDGCEISKKLICQSLLLFETVDELFHFTSSRGISMPRYFITFASSENIDFGYMWKQRKVYPHWTKEL